MIEEAGDWYGENLRPPVSRTRPKVRPNQFGLQSMTTRILKNVLGVCYRNAGDVEIGVLIDVINRVANGDCCC